MVKPHSSNFRVITTNVLCVRKLKINTVWLKARLPWKWNQAEVCQENNYSSNRISRTANEPGVGCWNWCRPWPSSDLVSTLFAPFFFFFFCGGFLLVSSRLFHKFNLRGETIRPSASKTWLSHMYSGQGLNLNNISSIGSPDQVLRSLHL